MSNDQLVENWFRSLDESGRSLPAAVHEELVADLREHVAAERAEMDPETEAGVRTLLERLGDPAAIVAEATIGVAARPAPPSAGPLPPPPPAGYPAGGYPAPPPGMPGPAMPSPAGRPGNRGMVIAIAVTVAAVVLGLCLFGFFFSVSRVSSDVRPDGPTPVRPAATASPTG